MLPTVFCRIRMGTIPLALLGAALVAVCPIQAQEKKTPPPVEVETLYLKAADADKVAGTLMEILRELKSGEVRVSVDPKQNQVTIQGSPEQMRAMRNLIDALGDKGLENPKDLINSYRSAQALAAPKDNRAKVRSVLSLINDDLSAAALRETAEEFLVAAVRDSANEPLGATLTPLNDALRAQLKVPAGQGILVASLRSDGPSALAGLKKHDILLTLGDNALTAPDDLTKYLKASGEAPVALKVLRAGKKVTLQIRPAYEVTLTRAVAEEKKEYYLGVQLESLDDALRAQLNFPAKKGVLVSSVVDKSPAQAAGVKPHDIILEYGGKAIENPEMLAAQVQAGQDRPSTLLVLREGKSTKIDITAGTRNVASTYATEALRMYTVRTRALGQLAGTQVPLKSLQKPRVTIDKEANLARQIEDLRQQVQTLHDTIDRLTATLKTNPTPPKK